MSGLSRLLLLALVTSSLAGCEDAPIFKDGKQDDRLDRHDQRLTALERRVDILESAAEARQREIDTLHAILGQTSQTTAAVAEQVARNADIANKNALKDATARGECGYTPAYQLPDGTWVSSGKIPCTEENYWGKRGKSRKP